MSVHEVTVDGTLQPDGTLQLDQKLNLTPGRVQVTVQPMPAPGSMQRGLVDLMDEIRASQQARGYQGRTIAEMQAEEHARQEESDEYDRRSEQLWGGPLPPVT
jgi:hypothetical protein